MILEALLEQNILSAFAELPELSGAQIIASRSATKTEDSDNCYIAIAAGFRQHDSFSLSPVTIPVSISIVSRVEGDAKASNHMDVVETIADKLSYWHKFGDVMQEKLSSEKCTANELRMDGGTNSVYDDAQQIWTDTINITIRGAEKFAE